jgi:hypothetical protein
MLCGQLYLIDREREKNLFFLSALAATFFSPRFLRNNELLLCFVVVVVSEQQMCI